MIYNKRIYETLRREQIFNNFSLGQTVSLVVIIAQTTDWLVCYELSIHYRAPFVQWVRIDDANYFLAMTKITEVKEERRQSICREIFLGSVYLHSSL